MLSRKYLKLALGLALLCVGTSSVFAAPGDTIGNESLLGSTTIAAGDLESTGDFSGSNVPCVAYDLTMSTTGTIWAGIFELATAQTFATDVGNGVYASVAAANTALKSLALSGSTCEFTSSTSCSQTHNLASGVSYVAAIMNPTSSSVTVSSMTVKECTAEQAAAASGASAITAVSAAILATVGALAL